MSLSARPARLIAADARADSGLRQISITAQGVAIERCVAGVRMRLHAPAQCFRGVALALLEGERGYFYRVALVHADPELDIVLAETDSERDIARAWRDWAQFFGLPRYARGESREVLVERRFGALAANRVQPRRRGWPLKARRSLLSGRRALGAVGAVTVTHRGEREIISHE